MPTLKIHVSDTVRLSVAMIVLNLKQAIEPFAEAVFSPIKIVSKAILFLRAPPTPTIIFNDRQALLVR